MFCQSQAYPTENNPEKSQIFLFFLFPKKAKGVKKKPEFQNLASKKPNRQLCYTGIENAHNVRKKTFNFLLCIEVQNLFPC